MLGVFYVLFALNKYTFEVLTFISLNIGEVRLRAPPSRWCSSQSMPRRKSRGNQGQLLAIIYGYVLGAGNSIVRFKSVGDCELWIVITFCVVTHVPCKIFSNVRVSYAS